MRLLEKFNNFLNKKLLKKKEKIQLVKDLKKEIELNIKQYNLIQSKESKLSNSKRQQVEKNIAEYIRVGHIKLEKL